MTFCTVLCISYLLYAEKFHVAVDHFLVADGFHHAEAFGEPALEVPFTVAYRNDGEGEAAERIFRAHFGYGHVERVTYIMLQAVGDTPLPLERVVAVHPVFHRKHAYDHYLLPACGKKTGPDGRCRPAPECS